MEHAQVRTYVVEFWAFLVEMYGDTFLNRKKNSDEAVEIEKKFAREGFPACTGFLIVGTFLKVEKPGDG